MVAEDAAGAALVVAAGTVGVAGATGATGVAGTVDVAGAAVLWCCVGGCGYYGGCGAKRGPRYFFRLVDRRSKKVAKNGLTVPVFVDFQRFWPPSVQKMPDLWTDAPVGLLLRSHLPISDQN